VSYVFFLLVVTAFAVAAARELVWVPGAAAKSPMAGLGDAMLLAAASSVTLALGLIGAMALFLGLMKVAEQGGLLVVLARLVRPLMVRLFPEVPAEHPAMGAMILNMSANVLGLGNAATPFGLRAMAELDCLNSVKGVASNPMVLFLAINTASVTVLPTSVIALRAAAGSVNPAGVVPTTLFATGVATAVAILMAKLGERWWPMGEAVAPTTVPAPKADSAPLIDIGAAYPEWAAWLALGCLAALIPATVVWGETISPWIVPGLMVAILAFGLMRKVDLYDAFVEGGKDGFTVAVRIIPYLVAILVAVAMLRESGAMDYLIQPLARLTEPIGVPAEALTMTVLRMLSGSGAYGYLAALFSDPNVGPDSYTGYLVSTIMASTETTFYVIAVYFGAVGIKRIRHALIAGLVSDVSGVAASVVAVKWMLG
jgi:spore maturation protein SpmA/spore maturation protein SpmB